MNANPPKTNETLNSAEINKILHTLCKEFTCTICLQLFNEPVTVSQCKHTYCQDCLKQWRTQSKQSTSKTFKCPLCKNITTNRSYYSNDKYAVAVTFLSQLNVYMESAQQKVKPNLSTEILQNYLNDCIKYKLECGSDKPEIEIDLSNNSNKNKIENVDVITESEENDFILNICSTAENINIINKLEDDFLNNLENETKNIDNTTKENIKTPSPQKHLPSTSNEKNKKTCWTRLKSMNRDCKTNAKKYKQLKITKSDEKKRTRSSKKTNEHFDEYIEEKKNASLLTETSNVDLSSSKKHAEPQEINEQIIDDDEDDDIFMRSTQILNLNDLTHDTNNKTLNKRKSVENIISAEDESQTKKIKTPDKISNNKIAVKVDVHHSNDSVINEPIRSSQNNDVIENTEEPAPKIIDPKLQTMNKELKETLKQVSELKSSMLQCLEQTLKESDNILTEYSNVVYSDSLFSSASGKSGQSVKKPKIPSSNICSAPNLNSSYNENVTFYNTAIPCLEKIKGYYEQLKVASQQYTQNSTDSDKIISTDVEVQTDILKCPTCTYTFNLKSALENTSQTPRNPNSNTNSNSEDFNAFLEDVKKTISSKNKSPEKIPKSGEKSKEAAKKRFKRIRPPSDSDSDESSANSKKSRNNSFQSKLLYREDIDVCFQNSVASEFNSNIENNKTTPVKVNKTSSEDTLLYLEQQYKNPINLNTSKSPEKEKTNIDNLLSGIDASAFENDFTINNGTSENPVNQNKVELSASLFTETQLPKSTNQPINKSTEEKHDNMTIIEDSCESDEIFEDDIVDTTPQKAPEQNTSISNKNKSEQKKSSNSQLELLNLQKQNIPSMTPDFLPLSNIDLNCGFFNSTKSQITQPTQTKTLNPLTIIQNEQCSPLNIVKQPQQPTQLKTNKEVAKHQSSILSFMNTSQQQQQNENTTIIPRCESPVLHSRPSVSISLSTPAILCTSRLQSDENNTIMTCAPRLNAKYSNVFNNSVTHLIVKVDHENCIVDQTIKYALAIAHGIWVLSYSWFKDSLNQNRLLPEEPYEVLDMSGAAGPKLSRLNRKTCPVFKDFVFYIVDPVVTATRVDLETVIINLGGIIKTKPEELQNIPGKHCLILAEARCCKNFDLFENWKHQLNLMIVDIEWLSETVGRFELTSIRPYALCSDENIENYGYPSSLIAQVPESQM